MQVIIDRKRWNLKYVNRLPDGRSGDCDSPDTKNKSIRISKSACRSDQRHLEVLLHEMLHAAVWSLDEEYVAVYARDAARVLVKLGFHLDDEATPCQ